MNILFITSYPPDLVRVRPFQFIRHLEERGHKVFVLSVWSNSQEKASLEKLEDICYHVKGYQVTQIRSILNCLRAVVSNEPLQAAYSWHPELFKRAFQMVKPGQKLEEPIDIVHVEHLRSAKYGIEINKQLLKYQQKNVPIVWDSVDSISHLFRQASQNSLNRTRKWITQFELPRTESYEKIATDNLDKVLVTSEIDNKAFQDLLNSSYQNGSIHVIPNGVDLEYFFPISPELKDASSLVISGKMSYHANISMVLNFVNEIYPLIRSSYPNIKLSVVGKDPPSVIRELEQDPTIEVTGTVPDIRPYLQKAAIALAPLTYGAGIQNKVLEAMACGTPVIASRVASQALEVKSGHDLIIADRSEDFAQNILRLLSNRSARSTIGTNGRKFVERNHNWDQMTQELERIYLDAISNLRV